jgi:glycosyltransferase involved in cell wall biosynthesis
MASNMSDEGKVAIGCHYQPHRYLTVDQTNSTHSSSRPLRVVLVSPPLDASGGIGRLMSYVLALLESRQIEVRHIDSRGRSPRPILSIGPLLRSCAALVVAKARRNVDVVHINMSYRGSTIRKSVVARTCRTLRIPVVLHLHTCEYEEFYRRLPSTLQRAARSTFLRADHVVVLGRVWESFVVDVLRVPPRRVTVLYNAAPGPPETTQRQPRSDRDGVRLLFVGQLGARKGVPELLAALSRLEADSGDWSLTMAGDGDIEGSKTLARELGILHRVTFTGWLDSPEVHNLLDSSDVLILPSRAEGLPMAIVEAFAFGVAVIASSVGAIPEIVVDRKSGLLVSPGEVGELEQAIRVLCADDQLREGLAHAGRRTWESQLEIGRYTERITEIWRSTAGGINGQRSTVDPEGEDQI